MLFTRLGFTGRKQEAAPNRFNVLASAGGAPRVVLNTHIDTVPPWFESSEDDEFIYGRGACDTKGIIAAMIAAAERLRADRIENFAMLLVVGEETDSIGAKSANVAFKDLGSDLPIETLRSTFGDLYSAYDAIFGSYSEDDRRLLFGDTARRIYGAR